MPHRERKNHQSPQESRASKHFQTPLGVEPQKLAHPHFPLISPCLLFNTKDRKLKKKKMTVQGLPGSRILPTNFSSGQSEEASALRERRFSADFSDKLGLPITHPFPLVLAKRSQGNVASKSADLAEACCFQASPHFPTPPHPQAHLLASRFSL